MKTKIWLLQGLFIFGCFLVCTSGEGVENKVEAIVPPGRLSPPEGNTTFLDATTWCVALPGASQNDLQIALDWACGLGMAECSPIQPHGPCFQPDNLVSHASFAFNSYYQQNGNNDIACNFGGTATLTKRNPSYGKCRYANSGPASSASTKIGEHSVITSVSLLLIFIICSRFVEC